MVVRVLDLVSGGSRGQAQAVGLSVGLHGADSVERIRYGISILLYGISITIANRRLRPAYREGGWACESRQNVTSGFSRFVVRVSVLRC